MANEAITVKELINDLTALPEVSMPLSVIINGDHLDEGTPLKSYTQIAVPNTQNGPAISVFETDYIPQTNVQTLIKRLNKVIEENSEYEDQHIRLLLQEDGAEMKLLKNNDGEKKYSFVMFSNVNDDQYEKYKLVQVVNGGTFASLVFTLDDYKVS